MTYLSLVLVVFIGTLLLDGVDKGLVPFQLAALQVSLLLPLLLTLSQSDAFLLALLQLKS